MICQNLVSKTGRFLVALQTALFFKIYTGKLNEPVQTIVAFPKQINAGFIAL
jgi:hypothetical protein